MVKRLLFWTVIIWGSGILLARYWQPAVEIYGQTKLQYDDEREVFFIETKQLKTDVKDWKEEEPMSVGMPVSFLKTSGVVVSVRSGQLSEEEMMAEVIRNARVGIFCAALVIWLLVLFIEKKDEAFN